MQYGFTTLFKNKILNDNLFNTEDPLYLGLFIDEGQPESCPTELTIDLDDQSTGYKRTEITFKEAMNGIISNLTTVQFDKALANWTTEDNKIVAIGVFNSYTGSFNESCLIYLPLAEAETVLAGQIFAMNPDAIKIQLV